MAQKMCNLLSLIEKNTMNEENTRILVVEDEFIVGIDIQQTLRRSNYKVISVVSSGEAAIEKAKTEKPDLVLMDITLKGKMDGIEAASVITRLGIPVIYLSALTDKDIKKRAYTTRPLGYLYKPFNSIELCSFIKTALTKYYSLGNS